MDGVLGSLQSLLPSPSHSCTRDLVFAHLGNFLRLRRVIVLHFGLAGRRPALSRCSQPSCGGSMARVLSLLDV